MLVPQAAVWSLEPAPKTSIAGPTQLLQHQLGPCSHTEPGLGPTVGGLDVKAVGEKPAVGAYWGRSLPWGTVGTGLHLEQLPLNQLGSEEPVWTTQPDAARGHHAGCGGAGFIAGMWKLPPIHTPQSCVPGSAGATPPDVSTQHKTPVSTEVTDKAQPMHPTWGHG